MFGVILWSDPQSGAAVIWCEERAEIAYCDRSNAAALGQATTHIQHFDAGDLVQFDMCCGQGTRLEVTNLQSANAPLHSMPPVASAAPHTPRPAQNDSSDAAPVIELGARRGGDGAMCEFSRRG